MPPPGDSVNDERRTRAMLADFSALCASAALWGLAASCAAAVFVLLVS